MMLEAAAEEDPVVRALRTAPADDEAESTEEPAAPAATVAAAQSR
jgi:hypothetical protein